jgi:two-component system sensor histidine kinase/response regulator
MKTGYFPADARNGPCWCSRIVRLGPSRAARPARGRNSCARRTFLPDCTDAAVPLARLLPLGYAASHGCLMAEKQEGLGTAELVERGPIATVLVVDDHEANRALAQGTLEDEGYRVIVARGGAEGLAAFEKERPDCVLLDVRMPDVDGFAVCERIRALPLGSEVPVLFLTAQRDVDTFDRALRAGGDDFLTKPVRPTELVVRVQSALKLRRMSVELREHYDLLRRQRDDLLRLQLQKERLMAFVVHDLKNPVNSMDLNAQLLLRQPGLPEVALEAASQIRVEARQLNRMIMNLLDLAKADEGRLSPKRSEVSLRALMDEVLAELSTISQRRKVTVRSALETDRIQADEDLLRRTVTNLVENAMRHAPPDTAIDVTASRLVDGTELRVADAGRGIPLAMRDRVFDPFVQIESGDSAMTLGGRGLGLTFCKLAVEAHGGRIWVEDAAPGAVFCVRLPHGA